MGAHPHTTRKKRDTREWVPKFQSSKFPSSWNFKLRSSKVLKFSSSQVPGTSSSQVPKFPELQVPKLPLKKFVKKKLSRVTDRPNPVPHRPGESIGGPCLEFHKQSPQTRLYLYNGYFENALDPLPLRPTTLDLMSGSPCSKKIRIASTCPPNTGHSPNAVSMLGQRRRRWANNIETTMGEWLSHHTTSLDVGLC